LRRALEDDFVVVGTAQSKAGREGFGALHLAVRDSKGWRYAGKVGSGFSEAELHDLAQSLDELEEADYPFIKEVEGRGHRWVEPELVVTVRYKEWREGRMPRQPVFVRLRPDKEPEECSRPAQHSADEPPEPEIEEEAAPKSLKLSNRDKVFWPDEGYTKGDLLDYYEAISPWLLPYLEDRPLVLTRYPDGIDGKSFFQKDAPRWVPDWVETADIWSEHTEREIHYFIANRLETLLYLVNLGSVPLHVWSSRRQSLANPDWCILDLDPKGAPWENVVRCAKKIHALCKSIELPCYLKTSGSSGLHLLIPLGKQCTYEESRNLAQVIFRAVLPEIDDIATLERNIGRRKGKVYLDGLQNRHGQLLVAPFSVRPLPGASVSMPLRWSELKPSLDFRRFNLGNAVARMRRMKEDPNRALLAEKPPLLEILDRLSELLRS
jgi:bifunctional non-homologous end joining protein LigD